MNFPPMDNRWTLRPKRRWTIEQMGSPSEVESLRDRPIREQESNEHRLALRTMSRSGVTALCIGRADSHCQSSRRSVIHAECPRDKSASPTGRCSSARPSPGNHRKALADAPCSHDERLAAGAFELSKTAAHRGHQRRVLLSQSRQAVEGPCPDKRLRVGNVAKKDFMDAPHLGRRPREKRLSADDLYMYLPFSAVGERADEKLGAGGH